MTNLLVIEDEDSLRDSLVDLLEAEGYVVAQAENGLLGTQAAEACPPDLIICDIMMPVWDGYAVLHHLRRTPTTVHIPFVFLTARADRSGSATDAGLGEVDYVTKPFTCASLLAVVRARLPHFEPRS